MNLNFSITVSNYDQIWERIYAVTDEFMNEKPLVDRTVWYRARGNTGRARFDMTAEPLVKKWGSDGVELWSVDVTVTGLTKR